MLIKLCFGISFTSNFFERKQGLISCSLPAGFGCSLKAQFEIILAITIKGLKMALHVIVSFRNDLLTAVSYPDVLLLIWIQLDGYNLIWLHWNSKAMQRDCLNNCSRIWQSQRNTNNVSIFLWSICKYWKNNLLKLNTYSVFSPSLNDILILKVLP